MITLTPSASLLAILFSRLAIAVVSKEWPVLSESGEDKWTKSAYPDMQVAVGDTIVFKSNSYHDLVKLPDQAAYESCGSGEQVVHFYDWPTLPEQDSDLCNEDLPQAGCSLGVYKIELQDAGTYFFKCTPHCYAGVFQKLQVTVTPNTTDTSDGAATTATVADQTFVNASTTAPAPYSPADDTITTATAVDQASTGARPSVVVTATVISVIVATIFVSAVIA